MKKTITLTFIIIQFIIVSLLLFSAGNTDYYIKREQLYPNAVYLCAGLIITALLCFLIHKLRKGFEPVFVKHRYLIVTVTILLFFICSLFICIGGFFFSDWDPAAILYGAYGVLRGHPEDTGATYFSNHPNNLLLVWIYFIVLKTAGIFGIDSVLSLVLFQCLMSSLAAFVFFMILLKMTEDPVTAYAGLLIYEIWIVLSPWFIITYSDEAGLIIPLLVLRLYQRMTGAKDNIRSLVIYWILISALAAAGYFIKPQIIICFISVVLYYVSDNKTGSVKYRAVFLTSCALLTLFFAMMIKSVLIPSLGMEIDSDRSFGMAHYFMMGLNNETDGVYSDDDTLYTDSFEKPEKKRTADMQLAKERLKSYGFAGLTDHAKKKILVNYNDGLFAWGVDGKFFAGRESEDFGNVPKTGMTDLIWSFIMPDGSNHGKYSSLLQMIWITILTLGLISGILTAIYLFRNKKATDENVTGLFVVMLSLTGLFLFELLFEAKARYLFIYTPYYLIAAVCGVNAITLCITDRLNKKYLPGTEDHTSGKD